MRAAAKACFCGLVSTLRCRELREGVMKKNREEESSIRWMNTNRRTEAGGGTSVGEGKNQKKVGSWRIR